MPANGWCCSPRSAAGCTSASCCGCGSATWGRWTKPLAVRYQQRLGGGVTERITFLSFPARQAVLDHLEQRRRADLQTGPDAPLVSGPDGRPASRATVARARRRANAVIGVGSRLNVELCRTTGEFFREWGLPGSRFIPAPTATAVATQGGERV